MGRPSYKQMDKDMQFVVTMLLKTETKNSLKKNIFSQIKLNQY